MILLKELKHLCADLSVLYVEDDKILREMVVSYLRKLFKEVVTAEDGQQGLDMFQKEAFDLVMTDIQMPNMNGIQMIEAIKSEHPEQEVIILTAFSEASYFMDAIRLDVSGYLIKPVDFENLNTTLHRIVDKIVAMRENKLYKQKLEELVEQEVAKNGLLEREKIHNYEQTLLALVEMIEKRDTYTGGHSQRVASYCKAIAQKMGCNDEESEFIYRAGILHDIGKIITPDAILLKPGQLKESEYKLIQQHVVAGKQLLEKIPMYNELALVIGSHHERYDGSGYPDGLEGEAIPFYSRIMIIADAFDAMTTNRIYKARMTQAEALADIQTNSGKQFDPAIIKYALEALSEILISTTIAQTPIGEIEQERFVYFYKDQITELYNQVYLDLILVQNVSSKLYKHICFISLHNFNQFNQMHGWQEGDLLLGVIGKYLLENFRDNLIFRFEGDDFIILSAKEIEMDVYQLEELIAQHDKSLFISLYAFNIEEEGIVSLFEYEKVLRTKTKGFCDACRV